MNKKLPLIVVGVVVALVVILGAVVWQKSSVRSTANSNSPTPTPAVGIKKVDLASQPEWVQKLTVTAKKGVSANGLNNVTVKASGMPAGLVQTLGYVLQYETTNKGTQGALSTTPLTINGATEFTKTIDLGTCSTKSCVRHEGVASVDLELDFTTSSGDQFAWSGTLNLQ